MKFGKIVCMPPYLFCDSRAILTTFTTEVWITIAIFGVKREQIGGTGGGLRRLGGCAPLLLRGRHSNRAGRTIGSTAVERIKGVSISVRRETNH